MGIGRVSQYKALIRLFKVGHKDLFDGFAILAARLEVSFIRITCKHDAQSLIERVIKMENSIHGAKWWKFDFHNHTPKSNDFGKGDATHMAITPENWLLMYMTRRN